MANIDPKEVEQLAEGSKDPFELSYFLILLLSNMAFPLEDLKKALLDSNLKALTTPEYGFPIPTQPKETTILTQSDIPPFVPFVPVEAFHILAY